MADATAHRANAALSTIRDLYAEVKLLRKLLPRDVSFSIPGTTLTCQCYRGQHGAHWRISNDRGEVLDDGGQPLRFYSVEALTAFMLDCQKKEI